MKICIKFFYTETPPAPVNTRYQFSKDSVTLDWESNTSCILFYELNSVMTDNVTDSVGIISDFENGMCYNNISVSAFNAAGEGSAADFDEFCLKGKC